MIYFEMKRFVTHLPYQNHFTERLVVYVSHCKTILLQLVRQLGRYSEIMPAFPPPKNNKPANFILLQFAIDN